MKITAQAIEDARTLHAAHAGQHINRDAARGTLGLKRLHPSRWGRAATALETPCTHWKMYVPSTLPPALTIVEETEPEPAPQERNARPPTHRRPGKWKSRRPKVPETVPAGISRWVHKKTGQLTICFGAGWRCVWVQSIGDRSARKLTHRQWAAFLKAHEPAPRRGP